MSLNRKVGYATLESWGNSMHTFLPLTRKQPDPACWGTNLANLTNLADLPLEL